MLSQKVFYQLDFPSAETDNAAMDPIIISVAPNGARKTKKDHASLPLSPKEIAAEAIACRDAGAVLLHMHIRDDTLGHSLDVGRYREAMAAVKGAVGDSMILQITSEAVGMYSPEEQMATIRALKPEAASFGLKEIIPTPDYEPAAAEFFRQVESYGTFAQFILYSADDALYFADLIKRGILPEGDKFVLFVLGKKPVVQNGSAPDVASSYASPEDLDPYLETFDLGLKLADTHWAICAFGGYELECMLKSVQCGGHVRIGFENNLLLANGNIAPNNAALVRQFVDYTKIHSPRPIATLAQAKKILGLK